MKPEARPIARVARTKAQAKANYDWLSRFYDLGEAFEQKYKRLALQRLNIAAGEHVLEVGCGTGACLELLAQRAGSSGRATGLDLSAGMLAASRRRLAKAGLANRSALCCGDALNLPYPANQFEAVFASFVLELFDTPEIPLALAEMRRVLAPGGRLGVLSMSLEGRPTLLLKLYERLHQQLPQIVDCRPIYVAQSVQAAGFEILHQEQVNIMGLPGEIVVCSTAKSWPESG